jgi:hypothetical protein
VVPPTRSVQHTRTPSLPSETQQCQSTIREIHTDLPEDTPRPIPPQPANQHTPPAAPSSRRLTYPPRTTLAVSVSLLRLMQPVPRYAALCPTRTEGYHVPRRSTASHLAFVDWRSRITRTTGPSLAKRWRTRCHSQRQRRLRGNRSACRCLRRA